MKQILVVDDHFLISIGLELLVKKVIRNSTVYIKSTYAEAAELLATTRIDLMVLDLNISGGKGPEMIESFRNIQKDIRILVCSGREEVTNAPACINAGAYGFLSKNAPDSVAEMAIEMVFSGKKYVSQEVQSKIIENFFNRKSVNINPVETLSPREREVLDLLYKGHSNKSIGDALNIKFSTVSTHKLRIFQKMDVLNSMDLFKKLAYNS